MFDIDIPAGPVDLTAPQTTVVPCPSCDGAMKSSHILCPFCVADGAVHGRRVAAWTAARDLRRQLEQERRESGRLRFLAAHLTDELTETRGRYDDLAALVMIEVRA